jgi:outer membrane receptor protein involved in Fe transport
MRTLSAFLLLLPLSAVAQPEPQTLEDHGPVADASGEMLEITVTAARRAQEVLATPASVSRIDGDELAALSAKHQADALNRSAGVYVQRGSGAE